EFWRQSQALLDRLPRKPKRNDSERAAANTIIAGARETRERFLRAYAGQVYDQLTGSRSRFLRVDDLVHQAAGLLPGLTPSITEIAADSGDTQGDKEGVAIDAGVLLS